MHDNFKTLETEISSDLLPLQLISVFVSLSKEKEGTLIFRYNGELKEAELWP